MRIDITLKQLLTNIMPCIKSCASQGEEISIRIGNVHITIEPSTFPGATSQDVLDDEKPLTTITRYDDTTTARQYTSALAGYHAIAAALSDCYDQPK